MNSIFTSWITAPDCESPWFYTSFSIEKNQKAGITICGLGFFELYCNGKKVSDDLLTPVWSNYEPREARRCLYGYQPDMTSRVYYMEYDLSSYLVEGENSLGVWLGNGWYNQHERNIEGDYWYGKPKLSYIIDITENGKSINKIIPNEDVLWLHSHIINNNIFMGEKHDYNLYLPDWCKKGDKSNWHKSVLTTGPNAIYQKQECPPDRVIRTLDVKYIGKADGGILYDCGENISGWAVIRSLSEGEIRVRYAEDLDENGNPLYYSNASPNGSQMQEDTFICNSNSEIIKPHFCWHGFRYFIIYGNAEPISCEVVHSDVKVTSDFSCDNEALNWLFSAYIRTQLDNYHCGVPSDCPHRERLGYTGDGQLTAETALLTLDSVEFYKKWMQDIFDCQDIYSGHVQHTAPYYGGGGGPGGWGCAIVQVPYALYKYTEDKSVLEQTVDKALRWIDYMRSQCEGHLVVNETTENGAKPKTEDCMCLGEWCTATDLKIPEPFVNTYFYIKSLYQIIEMLEVLHREDETQILKKYISDSKKAMVEAYFNPETGDFLDGVQAANAFALQIGLGDERTKKNLINRYENELIDTGIFGTDILLGKLFEYGKADVAINLMTQPEYPSFAYMQKSGATTIWESWNGKASRNHPMFGACAKYLFYYLLGIKKDSSGVWNISPIRSSLKYIQGYITTPIGKIGVDINETEIQITNETSSVIYYEHNGVREALNKGIYKFQL